MDRILFLFFISIVCCEITFSQGNYFSYHFDNLNRLIRVDYEDETTIEYTYDAVGNRLTHAISIVAAVYSHTEAVSEAGTYHFNENGDGHEVTMTFTSLSGSGDVTVAQTNSTPSAAPGANVANYQYDITIDEGITDFNADLVFHYTDEDVTGYSESTAYLGMAKFNAGTNTWNWLGGAIDAENNTVTVSGVTSFSVFAFYRRIFGDVTADGYVDAADLQRLGDCWHQSSASEFSQDTDARFFNYNKNTDNGNQIIDAADLQVFGDCWHNGIEPQAKRIALPAQDQLPVQQQKKKLESQTVNN